MRRGGSPPDRNWGRLRAACVHRRSARRLAVDVRMAWRGSCRRHHRWAAREQDGGRLFHRLSPDLERRLSVFIFIRFAPSPFDLPSIVACFSVPIFCVHPFRVARLRPFLSSPCFGRRRRFAPPPTRFPLRRHRGVPHRSWGNSLSARPGSRMSVGFGHGPPRGATLLAPG